MAQHSPASPSVQRAYRALLFVYPSDVRIRFGDEMQQLFLDDWQANQRSALPRSLVGMWWRALRATLANAFLIRRRRVGRWLVGMVLVVRSETNPLQLVGAIRQQIWASYPSIPLDRIATIDQTIADSMATPRFNSLLVGSFAGLALLLAAVGVYGVMAYTVEQRVPEIGLRQALGATVSGILGLVVWQGVKLTATGIAVGLGATLAVTRVLETMLFAAHRGVTSATSCGLPICNQ